MILVTKNTYEKDTFQDPNQRSATTQVYMNGSNTRDIPPCGDTHTFHHFR